MRLSSYGSEELEAPEVEWGEQLNLRVACLRVERVASCICPLQTPCWPQTMSISVHVRIRLKSDSLFFFTEPNLTLPQGLWPQNQSLRAMISLRGKWPTWCSPTSSSSNLKSDLGIAPASLPNPQLQLPAPITAPPWPASKPGGILRHWAAGQ